MNRYHSIGMDHKERRSSDGGERRGRSGGMLAVAAIAVSLMTGCAQNAAPDSRSASLDGSGSSGPAVSKPPDPYHYRCTGACIEDF